jgi:predicted AlkP superfamily phosphohydrolase/phosphomutase
MSIILVLLLSGCGGGKESTTADVAGKERKFESFASYLEFAKSKPLQSHQVVFVGIDGATWRILDPLIEAGKLPVFERLKNEGTYGDLRSTACYVSPPAWASMMCGYAPEKTGVYTFGKWVKDEGEFKSVTSADLRMPFAWDVASQAGKKVAVTNVPLTWPVHPVNGIMVSGLMTPVPNMDPIYLKSTDFTGALGLGQIAPGLRSFSEPVKTEGSDSLNTFVWWRIDSTNDGRQNYDRVALMVLPRLDGAPRNIEQNLILFDIGEYSPWLTVKVKWKDKIADGHCKLLLFRRTDGQFQASTSKVLLDPRERISQYTYPAELADELSSRFGYYMPSKFLKQKVVPSVTQDCVDYASFFYDYDDWDLYYYVFTQTDNIQHLVGFSDRAEEVYRIIDGFIGDLMDRMPEESTLIIGSDHGFKKYEWGIDLNEFYEQLGLLEREPDGKEIDFDRTMVFHNMWYVYFNRDLITPENLEAKGIRMEPGEEPTDALLRFLRNREIVRANDNRSFPVVYHEVEGEFAGDDPDLVVEGTYEDYQVEFWNLKRPRGQLVWRLSDTEQHHHELDGVYFVWGSQVKQGHRAGLHRCEDIAPTVLYLLGLPYAADMDGRPMLDVFDAGYVASRESYVVNDLSEIERELFVADEDNETLEKKLRSLGYVQ